jgi:uncharacterized membrane protein
MEISPNEAEETLEVIKDITQKTRHSMASGGTHITLLVTGVVWLIGFICTQFLPPQITGYIWGGSTVIGTVTAIILGARLGRRIHSPLTIPTAKRTGLFWLILIIFALAIIVIARPADGKQASLMIILFLMLGQLSMGMLFSFSSVWWALPIAVLAVIGYYLLPGFFYLWMAILGGGGMIALGLYIRFRW